MRETFGRKLLEFSKTVDILEEKNFEKIEEYIETYLSEVLEIKYVRLMLMNETLDGQVMLSKYALNRGRLESIMAIAPDKKYNGQMAYAFFKNKKLWITAQNRERTLNDCKVYIDHWSESDDLPRYLDFKKEAKVKTSIIIPISKESEFNEKSHVMGVVNFESKTYLPITRNAQNELKNISYALGKLYQLHESRKFQRDNTSEVVQGYQRVVSSINKSEKEYFFRKKPKIFFAFSDRADPLVIENIDLILSSKYKEKLKVFSWKDDNNLGKISPQLMKNIQESEYFICYLSEKDEANLLYLDNPNVLFELGYFIGKHEYSSNLRNLIIIRESKSIKNTPFDIKDIFILNVPRDEGSGDINRDIFISSIELKIDVFLRELE